MNRLLTLIICISLASCSVKYRCQDIPNDAGCRNMSEVYDRTGDAFVDNRGGLKQGKKTDKTANKEIDIKPSRNGINTVIAGEPVLAKAAGLRIWIAPWTDKNNDLHFSYVYIKTKDAEWTITK